MNFTVKNLPESVYKVIKAEAKRHRRSINAEIIQALEAETVEVLRRRRLSQAREEMERLAAAIGPLSDSTPLIRQERQRR